MVKARAFLGQEEVIRIISVADLDQQVVEVFLLFTESDGHGEKVLELSYQRVEHHNQFKQGAAVLQYFEAGGSALLADR